MARLSLLDLAFFIAETPASPKHVAGLHIHQRPKFSKPGAGKGFARALFDECCEIAIDARGKPTDFAARARTSCKKCP